MTRGRDCIECGKPLFDQESDFSRDLCEKCAEEEYKNLTEA